MRSKLCAVVLLTACGTPMGRGDSVAQPGADAAASSQGPICNTFCAEWQRAMCANPPPANCVGECERSLASAPACRVQNEAYIRCLAMHVAECPAGGTAAMGACSAPLNASVRCTLSQRDGGAVGQPDGG